MPSDRLVFKLHHRWLDKTIDFEACSVGEACAALRWDPLKVTVLGWDCEQCNNTGVNRDGYCTCPNGDVIEARENPWYLTEPVNRRRENPAIDKLGGLL